VRPTSAPPGPPVLVCGVDDPRTDRAAFLVAAELAKRSGGRLVLLHTRPSPLIDAQPQVAYAARQQPQPTRDLLAAARELADLAAAADVAQASEVRVGFGDPEKQLLALAREEQASLLVVGAGRELGRSRALRVISGAPCPVVVVPAADTSSARSGWGRQRMAAVSVPSDGGAVSSTDGGDVTSSILCGVDDSHDARLALRHAARLAEALDVRLVVAHVVQPPLPSPRIGPTASQLTAIPHEALLASGEAIVEKLLDEEGLGHVERRVTLGFPADRLADLADDEAAELVVVGSRGRGAIKAALLGSVSNALIGVARCPIFVIPPQAEPPSREEQAPAASLPRAA